jgi:hypothetical protein
MSNQDAIYWEFPEHISKDVIDLFLRDAVNLPVHQGFVGEKDLLNDFRQVSCQSLGEFNFFSLLLMSFGIKANNRVWRYDVFETNQCDLLTYHEGGDKYDGHVDTLRLAPGVVRKLTVLAFLNDDYEGGRFFIMLDERHKQYIETKAGTVIVFPSHMLHGVEPVTKGIRRSVVSWLVGPDFK